MKYYFKYIENYAHKCTCVAIAADTGKHDYPKYPDRFLHLIYNLYSERPCTSSNVDLTRYHLHV